MTAALVLGVNGQDGSYLAEILLESGFTVTGAARQPASRWVDPARFRYVPLDVTDADALDRLLVDTMPDQIFYLAAIHGSAGHAYEAAWRQALAVNVGGVHVCLEHINARAPATRLFYPSSLKVFGDPPPSVIDEDSPRLGSCLYSITKNAATDLIHHYRRAHQVSAWIGYYFNHDSPRRPDSYFLPRLAARIAGVPDAPMVKTLDFWCDWGSAREYMELTADLLAQDQPRDVVIATGRPVHAADLARALANDRGVQPPPLPNRTLGEPPFRARIDRLRQTVGRAPTQTALDVARWIMTERQRS